MAAICPRHHAEFVPLTGEREQFSQRYAREAHPVHVCPDCHAAALARIKLERDRWRRDPRTADPFWPAWPTFPKRVVV